MLQLKMHFSFYIKIKTKIKITQRVFIITKANINRIHIVFLVSLNKVLKIKKTNLPSTISTCKHPSLHYYYYMHCNNNNNNNNKKRLSLYMKIKSIYIVVNWIRHSPTLK